MCAPDIPDPAPQQLEAIRLQREIADKQLGLQDRMLGYFQQRQDRTDALQQQVQQAQMDLSRETAAQGRDVFEYQKRVFRPVEESLVAQAMAESTPEHYANFAAQAAARIAGQQEVAQGDFERNAQSLGINPNSGAYQAGQRGLQIATAAQRSAGMNEAFDKADALSFARKADVAGLGKGLVGAGNGSYGLALNGTNSALSGANETTRTAATTLGTPVQYGQGATQAGLNMGTLANDIYRTQAQVAGQGDPFMQAIGTVAGGWAAGGFKV